MRRARVLDLTREIPPGSLLEIGPGAGTLLTEFAGRGFRCDALELSSEARELVANVACAAGSRIGLHDSPRPEWKGGFDSLFAFDVLEHIEDDRGALRQWASWLRPGGVMVLSVPARMSLWTAGDEWAGHFRRYERDQLVKLVEECGLVVEKFECYGFPLTNFTERVSASSYRRAIHAGSSSAELDRKINNDRSGIDRKPHLRLYPLIRSWPGQLGLWFFYSLQKLFLKRDLGSGYILRARIR
ncbi:MAG TPA: class I SAM-dependent methyltransferase [Lysobacter sp.]|nr:class I SAM-dependent methyltransferase [Lysobacter sp.]